MSRLQGETRELLCELTGEELEAKGRELAAAVEEEQELRLEFAEWWAGQLSVKKARKEAITQQEGVCGNLASLLQKGQERRGVPCTWLYALAAGYSFLVRDDTGELVTHRRLRDEERQTSLLEEPYREPTPEQLAEWLKTLPVNEEEVLPEGHAGDVEPDDRAVDIILDPEADESFGPTSDALAGTVEDWEEEMAASPGAFEENDPALDTEEEILEEQIDAILTDAYGEPLDEPVSAGATTPPLNLNPSIPELAAMPDEQAEKLVERSRTRR